MKENCMFDMGQIMDQVFETAQKMKHAFKDGFPRFDREGGFNFTWDENTDFYPLYSYPPSNVYLTKNRELILEFALAGFDEKDVDLQFQGDYLVLSAKETNNFINSVGPLDSLKFYKINFTLKNIYSSLICRHD